MDLYNNYSNEIIGFTGPIYDIKDTKINKNSHKTNSKASCFTKEDNKYNDFLSYNYLGELKNRKNFSTR
jgi:hypothetical protein